MLSQVEHREYRLSLSVVHDQSILMMSARRVSSKSMPASGQLNLMLLE